jgi:hypothetical protein
MSIILTLNVRVYVSKDVRIIGYFLKAKVFVIKSVWETVMLKKAQQCLE